jgi:hypothetical protein
MAANAKRFLVTYVGEVRMDSRWLELGDTDGWVLG